MRENYVEITGYVIVPLFKDRWINSGKLVNLLNVLADRTIFWRSENFLRKPGHRYQALKQ